MLEKLAQEIVMDSMITLGEILVGGIPQTGRTIDKLGLSKLSKEEIIV
ncbi:hypothetical protein [Peribacillus sp. NPDC096540]